MAKLSEYRPASDEEYIRVLKKTYGENNPIVSLILQGESGVKSMFGGNFESIISDDEKLIVRWMETEDDIYISALISVDKRLSRSNAVELRELLSKLRDKLIAGKSVWSSVNENSMPIIDRVLNQLRNDGYRVIRRLLQTTRLPEGEWRTYKISIDT